VDQETSADSVLKKSRSRRHEMSFVLRIYQKDINHLVMTEFFFIDVVFLLFLGLQNKNIFSEQF